MMIRTKNKYVFWSVFVAMNILIISCIEDAEGVGAIIGFWIITYLFNRKRR